MGASGKILDGITVLDLDPALTVDDVEELRLVLVVVVGVLREALAGGQGRHVVVEPLDAEPG